MPGPEISHGGVLLGCSALFGSTLILLTTLTVREGKSGKNLKMLGKTLILGLEFQVWTIFVFIFEIYAFFYAGCTGQFIFWTFMDPFHYTF